jgi:hypothetical protein
MINKSNSYGTDNASNNIDSKMFQEKKPTEQGISPLPPPPLTSGHLLSGCSIISVSFIICMLILLLMPLAGLYFCVGLDFVTPS